MHEARECSVMQRVSVVLPDELLEALTSRAEVERRSLSSTCRLLLERAVEGAPECVVPGVATMTEEALIETLLPDHPEAHAEARADFIARNPLPDFEGQFAVDPESCKHPMAVRSKDRVCMACGVRP